MTANNNLIAVFTAPVSYLFYDGFESGDFSKWNGTILTSGETATVTTTRPHHGTYSALFTTNGTGGTERAYSYVNFSFSPQTEIYVRGYFNIENGLSMVDNDDRFNFFALQNANGDTIASAGVRRINDADLWSITTSLTGIWNATQGPSTNQWYCVELYVKINSPNGALTLWINGVPVINQTGLNLGTAVAVTQLRAGLSFVSNINASVATYMDCIAMYSSYIGPEEITPPQQYNLIIQAGTGGTTTPAPDTYQLTANTHVEVQANASIGYAFSHWLLNNTDVGTANPYSFNIDANYNLTAVFTEDIPEDKAYLVARGIDNSIYYRLYNIGSDTWGNWQLLPGATSASPAACVFQNELHLVVMGIDGNTMWHGYVNLANDQFSGWQVLEGAAANVPTLATNGTVLTVVAQGLDNAMYIRNYQDHAWGSWHSITTGLTGNTPAATFEGTNLHVIAKEVGGSAMYDAIVTCTGTIVQNWRLISGAAQSTVTLTSANDKEYLLARGLDNTIYYRTYNIASDTWNDWHALTGLTCDTPAATVTDSTLQIVVRGIDLNSLWKGTLNTTTDNFTGWILIEGTTPSKPTLTS
jgi:hypothetical protein